MSNQAETPTVAAPKGGLVTYLNIDGAIAAADFYKRAFGAEIVAQQPADDQGRTMHIHLQVNGSSFMLSDFFAEHGHAKVAPQGYSLVLMVKDIHNDFQRAVDAGATVVNAVYEGHGWRIGRIADPFGHHWEIGRPLAG